MLAEAEGSGSGRGGKLSTRLPTFPHQEKPRLLMVCHMPPPVHGAAVMGQMAANSKRLQALFDVTVIPIRINSGFGTLQRFNLGKVWSSLKLCGAVVRAIVTRRPAAMYLTANISGFAFWRDLVIVLICRMAGVRRVFHFHMKGLRDHYERSRLMRIAYRAMFRNADVVHLSARLYRDVEPVVPPQRFHVVANGIGGPLVPHAAEPSELPTVLFLSNLYASKGPLDLLEASRQVSARGIAHKLVFAGAGPEPDVVHRICGAGGQVSWAGPVEGAQKEMLLRQADVFVFPSYYHFECQPLAVIEAMAHGKAIIASDEAAIPDLVADGETGFIVKSRAVDEIAQRLALLLSAPGLRDRFGAAARAAYEQGFTAGSFEQRLADTLVRLCAPGETVAAANELAA